MLGRWSLHHYLPLNPSPWCHGRYFTFGVHTNSDVLTNYGPRLTIVLITRFVLTFIVIFTYGKVVACG